MYKHPAPEIKLITEFKLLFSGLETKAIKFFRFQNVFFLFLQETNQAAVNDYSNYNVLSNNDFSNTELPPALSSLVMSMNKQSGLPNQLLNPPQLMVGYIISKKMLSV